jgi:hypothetical protein
MQEQNLRLFYGYEDFDHLWRRIVTNIKISRFIHLNQVSGFHKLPNKLQNEITNEVEKTNDYKTFSSEQYFNNSYVILFTKENVKWIAIFQEKILSKNIQASIISILIASLFYIMNALNKLTASNNSKDVQSYVAHNLFEIGLIILSLAVVFYFSQKWLTARESKYNGLIEACMLKKLQTLTNP